MPSDLQAIYELSLMTAPALEAAIESGKVTPDATRTLRESLEAVLDTGRWNVNVSEVKAVTTHTLRWELTHVVQEVIEGKRLVVTFHGKPKFGLVPLADLEKLEGKPVAIKPTKRQPK